MHSMPYKFLPFSFFRWRKKELRTKRKCKLANLFILLFCKRFLLVFPCLVLSVAVPHGFNILFQFFSCVVSFVVNTNFHPKIKNHHYFPRTFFMCVRCVCSFSVLLRRQKNALERHAGGYATLVITFLSLNLLFQIKAFRTKSVNRQAKQTTTF